VPEPRLLVVANPYESAMLRRAAEHAGIVVREAEVDDAEEALREHGPDVIVLAAATAQGDGLALAHRVLELRGDARSPRLILLGGSGGPVRSLEEARAEGADDFLARPVDLKALVAKVLDAVGQRPVAPPTVPDLGAVVAARIDAAFAGALDSALDAVPAGAPVPVAAEPPVAAPAEAPLEPPPASAETPPPPPAAASPEPPSPPEPPPPPVVLGPEELDRIRGRIANLLELVAEGDYFAVLGLGRSAGAAEARLAYEAACRELDPAALGDLGRERESDLAAIRGVLDEAVRVLGEDEVRAAYTAHLAS
jgi:CheY-like chemotaxis protein